MAALVTWPMLATPLSRLVGDPNLDVWNHAWGPWWWWDSLSNGTLPWRTDLLIHPLGGVLWFIDPILAAVGAPLVPLLGAAGAYNVGVLLSVALASWGAGQLGRELGAGPWTQWVASGAVAASAWIVCEVHNGITESAAIGLVAIAMAWVERAARCPSYRTWLRAGVGVGLAAVASPYLGLGAAIYALIRGLPTIRHAWAGGLVAILVGAPPSVLLRLQLEAVDAVVKHPEAMNVQLALHNAVDPRIFIAPFGFRSVDLTVEGFEHSMYLGLVALVLAAVGARHLRGGRGVAWLITGALATLVMALGPYLYWDDTWLIFGSSRFRLPWWAFQRLAPGLAATHPLRLAAPALVAVGGLAAVGAHRLLPGRKSLILVALVMVDGLIISGSPWPQETSPAGVPPALLALERPAAEPANGAALLNLPTDVGETMATSRYLFWQSGHRRAIPYAPDARASTSPLIHAGAFRTLAAESGRRSDEETRLGLDGPATAPPTLSLRDHGIRWIALHHDLDADAAGRLDTLLTTELGAGVRTGDTTVWDLGQPDPPHQRRGLPQPQQAPSRGSGSRGSGSQGAGAQGAGAPGVGP
jgi:hypothetical protein